MVEATARKRLGFVDAARTLAMALMVQGHVCDNLLSPEGKAGWLYQHHLVLRGMTGPLFFFVSGFAFVVASNPAWEEYGRPGRRLWARLKRVATLLAVGWFLQVPRWSGPAFSHAEWRYVFRCGVLHAIAIALVVALVLIAATRTRRAFTAAAFTIAVLSVVVGHLASSAPILPEAAGLFLRTQEGSLFPATPWMAHFLLGAVLARLHLDVPWLSSTKRLALFVGSAGAILLSTGRVWQAFSPVDTDNLAVWVSDPEVFLARAGMAWCAFGAFALLLDGLQSRAWLQAVASHALSIYVVHLVALYGWPGMDGLVQRFGPTLGVGPTYLTGPLLFAGCALFVVALFAAVSFVQRQGRSALGRLFPAAGAPS
ncbi:MAG: heparan-alpha-glucosaminide N-acetyltransferase domain-containing protein [Myxococcales bacterium]